MADYFKNIDSFIIDPCDRSTYIQNSECGCIPTHVVDKIIRLHKPELNGIRDEFGAPVMISGNSGYRSFDWEISKGRKGDSEHTFGDGHEDEEYFPDMLGAVDITCKFLNDLPRLWELAQKSGYKRVALYRDFIHCDFSGDEFRAYDSREGKWKQIKRER